MVPHAHAACLVYPRRLVANWMVVVNTPDDQAEGMGLRHVDPVACPQVCPCSCGSAVGKSSLSR